jgi:5-methylcytosine-specific restriction protein A
MNPSITQFVERLIADRIGLSVVTRQQFDKDGEYLDISLTESHPANSFIVRFRPGWRSAEAVFIPGTFAAPLITQMGNASKEGRATFKAFLRALVSRRMWSTFRINGKDVLPDATVVWPPQWITCELSVRTPHLVVNPDDIAQIHSLITDTVIPLFSMLAALIGVDDSTPASTSALEGRAVQSIVTRYERKQINREACIAIKGTNCVVCGFNFFARYGLLGNGYIEVHHTTPVSSMGPEYAIDVATELEPLCANCHAMAHREEPPVSIARLRSIIAEHRGA